MEQEKDDAADNEEESGIGEYTLWTGTFTLYAGEKEFVNVLQEEGYDTAGNMILEGYYGSSPVGGFYIDNAMRSDVLIGSWIKRDYDEHGNVTKETAFGSHGILNNEGTVGGVYENEYDASGNLTSYISADSRTEYECDTSGNPIKETFKNGTGEEYEYDASGNLTKVQSIGGDGSLGNWIEYEYAESDKRPPEIAEELMLIISIMRLNNKLQNNPVKITWYKSDGSIDKAWEWTYEVINE